MNNLLKYKHDRKSPFDQSTDKLKAVIDAFAEQKELNSWYDYFEEKYSLPKQVIKQQMKSYLVSQYDFRKCSFQKKLFPKNILKDLLKYFLFIIYLFFRSKRYLGQKNYDLIVEWIENSTELNRFSKLINLFGRDKVLVVAVNPINEPGYQIIHRSLFHNYDWQETLKTLKKEFFHGLWLQLKLSFKLKFNFFKVSTYIVNHYLYYYSIFKFNLAKFCLQERHYATSAIKNHLFHHFGGKYSTSIQKNIIQRGHNGFYYDIDVLFSLGKKTTERAFQYGARIDKVVPVGSMFMEYYWFNNESLSALRPVPPRGTGQRYLAQGNKNYGLAEKIIYDVIFLGNNVSMAKHYVDSYEAFLADYYETFRWLIDFSRRNPHIRLGIKHHPNNLVDKKEMEIIEGSSVKRIDQNLNSYQVASGAKCLVTSGSTMGFEMLAHGVPVLFFDPGGRNCQFLPKELPLDYRITNQEEFENKIKKILEGEEFLNHQIEVENFCLKSKNVSENIYNWFLEN